MHVSHPNIASDSMLWKRRAQISHASIDVTCEPTRSAMSLLPGESTTMSSHSGIRPEEKCLLIYNTYKFKGENVKAPKAEPPTPPGHPAVTAVLLKYLKTQADPLYDARVRRCTARYLKSNANV